MLYRTWFDAMSVRERWERASSRSRTAKLLTPIFRIRPARWRASRAFIVSRSGTWLQGSGQCTWYKSMSRTPSRRRLAAHARFTSSARRCQPPTFVATKTRSRPTFRIARDMTCSEWPSPYASAVSTRLTPTSTARSIASRHSASRTSEPQAFPPACHIPSPTAEPSGPPRPNDTYSIQPPRGRRIAAIWSTVRAPCFVVARTRAPGIRASSIDARQRTCPSRTFRLAGLHFLDGVFDDRVRGVDARRVQEPAEAGGRVDLEDVRGVPA